MKYPVAGIPPFGDPGAAFGEALGRLGGAFLGDVVAHCFFIVFLNQFSYVFGMVFGIKIQRKNDEKTKLILKCFLDGFCDGSVSFPSQCVL